RDGEALRRLVTARRGVGTHQNHAVNGHARVHDFAPPFCWHMSCHGRISIREDRFDLAAEALFVKLERLLAPAVEYKIWIQLHFVLLLLTRTFRCNFCLRPCFEFSTNSVLTVFSCYFAP